MTISPATCHSYYANQGKCRWYQCQNNQAREHLATAREMIEEMGYGRRKGEVEELGKALTAEDAEDAEKKQRE